MVRDSQKPFTAALIKFYKTKYSYDMYLELQRIELRTSRMQSEHSTTELQPLHAFRGEFNKTKRKFKMTNGDDVQHIQSIYSSGRSKRVRINYKTTFATNWTNDLIYANFDLWWYPAILHLQCVINKLLTSKFWGRPSGKFYKQIVNNSLCIANDHLARSVPSQTARRFPFVSIRRLIAVSNAT